MAAASTMLPPHLRPAAGKFYPKESGPLRSSASTPALSMTISGLPADVLARSSAVRVSPVDSCEAKRRDSTVGYRGFVPGKAAETVFGEGEVKTREACYAIRPAPSSVAVKDYTWQTAPDDPIGRRSREDVATWAHLQQYTPWINGGRQPRDYGPATLGYGGKSCFRLTRAAAPAETVGASGTLKLEHTMRKDRDVQPFDMHRSLMPGYAGFIRHQAVS